MPKRRIEEAAAARQARVDKGEDVIVGVNKYRLAQEAHLDTLDIDNHAVREGQIARLKAMRATRDEAKCRAELAALTAGARNSNPAQPEPVEGHALRPAPSSNHGARASTSSA